MAGNFCPPFTITLEQCAMYGTQQNWNLVWNGDLMTTTPNPEPTCIPRGFGIDSRIGVAAPRAPAASREDSRPQAILKSQPHNSFDYRVRYESQLRFLTIWIWNMTYWINMQMWNKWWKGKDFRHNFFSCVSDDFLMKPPSQANQEGEVKGHSKTPLTRFPSFLTTLTDIFLEI